MTREELEKVSYLEYCRKEREILDSLGRIGNGCDGVNCNRCPLYESSFDCDDLSDEAIKERLEIVMNYEKKQKIDWSKVKIDTPVYVKNIKDDEWKPAYFAKYENGKIYVFDCGTTSITNRCDLVCYNYAKLGDINNVSKINNNIPKNTNWDILEKNTLVWVRRTKNDDVWLPRYFAKYSNGKVYTFINGKTSFTTKQIVCLNCVKLTNVSIIGYNNTKEAFVSCV